MPPPLQRSRLDGLDSTARAQVTAAAEALDTGRIAEAVQRLQPVLDQHADHPEVLRMHAGILGMRGLHAQAIDSMQKALSQRPQDAVYYNTLGTLLGNSGDFDSAVAVLRRCCQLQPGMAIAWFNLGIMLTRCVRNEEASIALQRAVSLAPDDMGARALLADLLRTAGKVEEATTEYRKVLAERPATGIAWWGLADLRSSAFSAADLETMKLCLAASDTGDDDRIAIGFALAKACDERGQYAKSLAALVRANDTARRRQKWNAEAFSQTAVANTNAFDDVSTAAAERLGEGAIFIVGMPRSGSTLVEQILASHSAVNGAGELPDLPMVLNEESRRRGQPFPQWVAAMQSDDWARLGQRYLERVAHWRQERPMFTDKLPNNWMYMGAIRAMLPAARTVVCRRDPLETCFSCYRQYLANNEYTRTFADLASFWFDFDRAARHWKKASPRRVYEHRYEELLADPETHIRKLLAFCELPYEPACVQFHETQREVRSPSATQVRQPLRRDTARAPRYGALLDPLRAALSEQCRNE